MDFLDKVKSFANDAANTLNNAAKDVSDNIKTYSDKSKVKSNIKAEEQKIAVAYKTIGEQFFKENTEIPVGYEQLFNEIKTAMDKIEQLQNELIAIEAANKCSNCGAGITSGQKFCQGCGANLTE